MSYSTILVNNTSLLSDCLAEISLMPFGAGAPSLAVDLEGIELCRYGKISIVQLKSSISDTIWIVDVTVLGAGAFNFTDKEGRSLRRVLESTDIRKVFFDVRNDADALYNLYAVDLKNVYDLQILELAVRKSLFRPTRCVNGLARCIEDYISPPRAWKEVKESGVKLFAPERGGSYAIFEQRPLDRRILEYCAQDVSLLFDLETELKRQLRHGHDTRWETRIIKASEKRLGEALDKVYAGKGKHRAMAPHI